ncbi:hypothetical protein QMK61_03460 [Fulvimonas sp. R45]|uniref:hypothetical protein n=1 Tax=Fulvimonas sp. R45 TaxID=3045937 RepID=UPI00265EB3D9|nr:hypothetical protein [Fulvimonas sp. R45]MDO1527880.1 hypothetical protein [Fulvimonas sp. R45]
MKRHARVLAAIALPASTTAVPTPATAQDARPAMHGKADPAAVVELGQVRFAVLTPRMTGAGAPCD